MIDTHELTVEAALKQSRLSDSKRLPGKEVREVCVAKRIRTISELSTWTLATLFDHTTCSVEGQEFVNDLLRENDLPPIPFMQS